MKIAIVSKPRTVMNWAEDAQDDLREAGHEVKFFATRHRFLPPVLNNVVYSDRLGGIRASFIVSALRAFRPDVILAVGAYQLPAAVLERIAGMPDRGLFVAWVGNRFNDAQARKSEYFDLVGYTDTGIIEDHKSRGLTTACMFLPHAARAGCSSSDMRSNRMVFIGNANSHRRAVLNAMELPVDIYGPRWGSLAAHHSVYSRRVSPSQVEKLYRSHSMTANIKNDVLNIDGLNQRHFSPFVFGCAVVAEFMKDVDQVFQKDREIFCWSSLDELNGLYAELQQDADRVRRVAEAGNRRVVGEHLYRHRIDAIVRNIG